MRVSRQSRAPRHTQLHKAGLPDNNLHLGHTVPHVSETHHYQGHTELNKPYPPRWGIAPAQRNCKLRLEPATSSVGRLALTRCLALPFPWLVIAGGVEMGPPAGFRTCHLSLLL